MARPLEAEARDFRVNQIPNGQVFGCLNCHMTAAGGGARNPFGIAVQAITGTSSRAFWSATLAGRDSDGDGAINGQELGDPDGDGTPIPGARVTNPGSAASRPPQNQAPTVTVTGPADGTVLTLPAVALATAEAADGDGSVVKVEFFSDGESLGAVTEPPYRLLVDWALGGHSLTARATDDQGASTTSSAVGITVVAPAAPVLAAPVREGETLRLEWTEGGGPFWVQSRLATEDTWRGVGDVSVARSAEVNVAGEAVSILYRVADFAVGGPIGLTVSMSGAAERPTPVAGAGSGSGTLSVEGNTLTFDIRYEGLGGAATAAHIHGSAGVEEVAGVMIDLAPFNGGSFGAAGSLIGSVVVLPEQKAAILSGKTYVNVHTAANPDGEIRGQIVFQPASP